MRRWDELVAAALIGTDRRPVEASAPPGSPAGLEAALAERGAEDRLLGVGGGVDGRAAGGRAAPASAVAVEPAAEDPRPGLPPRRAAARCCSRASIRRSCRSGSRWRRRAGCGRRRSSCPTLLDHAARDPALHAAVGAAAGPLGRWLAERAPRWAFVRGAGDDVEAVWADGERAERRALLERLRRTRSRPRARELLAATFADETWEDREAFVAALADGLSDADEPLLEAALDDRASPSATPPRSCSRGLPALALRRAHGRARRAAAARRGRRGLVVDCPEPPDAAAQRDGARRRGGRRCADAR